MNEALRNQGGSKEKLLGLIFPQTYVAVSISDFLKERQEIETNGFFKSIFLMISLMNYYHKAAILLNNVRYNRIQYDVARLEDLTATLDLPIRNPAYLDAENQKQEIINGDRVHLAQVLYHPSLDQGYLLALSRLDFQVPEKAKLEMIPKDLVSV